MPGYSRHLRPGVKTGGGEECLGERTVRTVPELPRRRGGALNHGRPGVPPLRNVMRRRVREAAPYMGWNLRDGRVWDPPLRRIRKRFLLFRRGRTLAGPSRKFCHSRAHPHPSRFAWHRPPGRGKALQEGQIPIPSVSLRSISPLDKGSRPLPYGFQMGRGGPWASRRSMETGRPSVPPLRFYTGTFETLGGRVRAPAPTANLGAIPSFS